MPAVLFLVTIVVVFILPLIAFGQPCECSPVTVSIAPVAAAAAEPVQEWWQALLVGLMDSALPIIGTVLGTFATLAVRKWGKKLDTEKQDSIIKLTNDFIGAGIGFAEEQGRKALNDGADRTEGADKMAEAMGFIQERLKASGLDKMAEVELKRLIESKLAQERVKPDGVVLSEPPTNGDKTATNGEAEATP